MLPNFRDCGWIRGQGKFIEHTALLDFCAKRERSCRCGRFFPNIAQAPHGRLGAASSCEEIHVAVRSDDGIGERETRSRDHFFGGSSVACPIGLQMDGV